MIELASSIILCCRLRGTKSSAVRALVSRINWLGSEMFQYYFNYVNLNHALFVDAVLLASSRKGYCELYMNYESDCKSTVDDELGFLSLTPFQTKNKEQP